MAAKSNSRNALDDKFLNSIAGGIGMMYNDLGTELDVTHREIENIRMGHPYPKQWAFQILVLWRERQSKNANMIVILARALKNIQLVQLAEDVESHGQQLGNIENQCGIVQGGKRSFPEQVDQLGITTDLSPERKRYLSFIIVINETMMTTLVPYTKTRMQEKFDSLKGNSETIGTVEDFANRFLDEKSQLKGEFTVAIKDPFVLLDLILRVPNLNALPDVKYYQRISDAKNLWAEKSLMKWDPENVFSAMKIVINQIVCDNELKENAMKELEKWEKNGW
ncbi:unnamed protein product [Owenia fusiformis]|uniref:Death domain-containing protein n=1 Tax=Owenia fusiformis TaxID=6347 RepID=A0A8S4Q6R6_OWEFU|nr:unnamed protein product [Owenia fusiformis]